MKKITFLVLLIGISILSVKAQPWMDSIYLGKNKSGANFYDIQKAFYKYWGNKPVKNLKNEDNEGKESELGGYFQFKRWEYQTAPKAYPDGVLPSPLKYWNEYLKFSATEKKPEQAKLTNTWTPLGLLNWTCGNSGYSPGNGRINAITVDPNNANVIYIGAPAGGVWKSVDGGTTWNTTSDYMPHLGVSTIAVDHNNSNIVYIGTGDRDAGDCPGIGILKSTDAGATWHMTGMDNSTSGVAVCRMLINPQNSNSIIAACGDGMWKSVNAGTSWTKWSGSNVQFYDVEFKPGDTTIVYATTGGAFYKSTNGGSTYTNITSGLPTSCDRYEIAVTAANSAYVYLVASNYSDDTFKGLYRSINSGTSFLTQSTSPNILGYATDGSDNSGQGWYDLSIAASPTNANEIYVGSINQWKSTNGGVNWTNLTDWTYPPSVSGQYTHCDIHELIYPAGGTKIYTGTDGGAFYTTNAGSTWTNISSGLGISQCYAMGGTESNASLIVAGMQDNGINKYTGSSTWSQLYGADGFVCAVDFSNSNTLYAEVYNGSLMKSTDGGNNWNTDVQPSGQYGAWCTPYIIHPTNHNLLFMGFGDVYKSTNGTTSWTAISSGLCPDNITSIASAPSNANYIYAAYNSDLYVTTNGGTSWATKTPNSSMSITGITVDNNNPSKLWICGTGSSSSNVYVSTNAGNSWTDITGNLTNLGFNCIVHQKNAVDDLYLGTEVGVFHKDSTSANWTSYNNNLPNVKVSGLDINYTAGLIRAATFGRGIWETTLYTLVNVKENELNNLLSVFPNPATNNFTVRLSLETEKNIRLTLFDVIGNAVKTINLGSQKDVDYLFDISKLVEGTYFIKVEAGDAFIVKKVTKI